MDSTNIIYNELNITGKILYIHHLNMVIDFIEGKDLKLTEKIEEKNDRKKHLEIYEKFLTKIKDPEIKAKCERFIQLRKQNIALLEELGE